MKDDTPGLYSLLKQFSQLVDIYEGKEPGTTPPDEYSEEELVELAGRLSRTITLLEWCMTGIMGMLKHGYGLYATYLDKRKLPYYDFEWDRYIGYGDALTYMIEAGSEFDLLSQPSVMHEVFRRSKRTINLPNDQKSLIWNVCRGGRYNRTRAVKLMQALRSYHQGNPDDDRLLRQVIKQTYETLEGLNVPNRPDEDVADEDRGGEGAGPEADPQV